MKQLKNGVVGLLLMSLPFPLGGCSFFQPWDQTLHIRCEQPEVKLEVNGAPYDCPSSVTLRRNKTVNILARKEGYPAHQRTIQAHISTTGILDMIGGFIIILPFIGMAAPGAFDLDTTNVFIDLGSPPPTSP